MAVPDGQGTVPVNLQGQFFPAESPHNDYNTADIPKAYNPWTHNDPFFIGGGESINGILSCHQTQMSKLLMK